MTPRRQTHQPTAQQRLLPRPRIKGTIAGWLERHARTRLTGPRVRRALAHALRQAADPTKPTSRLRPRRPVLRYRAAAVRVELLEIAALLEHAQNPDPSAIRAVRALLRDHTSPLYDLAVNVAELRTTLADMRNALDQRHATTNPLPREPT